MLKHKQNRRGFTLVEVSLFLAVTGLLFVGIAVGVQNSIYQQRFNDSVQNFTEFLRSAYSGVNNVENNTGKGNSKKAIYGKLITFGQEDNKASVYTVIGDIEETDNSGNTLDKLKNLRASVRETPEESEEQGDFAGIVEDYSPRWRAQIKNTDNNIFKGSILIVRNPVSGVVYTYYFNDETNPDEVMDKLAKSNPSTGDIDFCISPEGVNDANASKDVRIPAKTRSASGIEIISDGDGNRCKK